MAVKPNYNHQRAERDRARQIKKQEKLKHKQDVTAQRKPVSSDSQAGGGDSKG